VTLRIDRRHPARIDGSALDLAVVIDVLRATSTAAVLAGRGARELLVAATPDDLARLPAGSYQIFSELACAGAIDNSPFLAESYVLDGKQPALVTTNGTRALLAASACARRVFVASFLSLTATCRAIVAAAPERVTLLPAGKFERAEPHFEDERCADAIEQILERKSPDLAAIAASCREDARVIRRMGEIARDVDLALSPDRYPVVLEFHPLGGGTGRLCVV